MPVDPLQAAALFFEVDARRDAILNRFAPWDTAHTLLKDATVDEVITHVWPGWAVVSSHRYTDAPRFRVNEGGHRRYQTVILRRGEHWAGLDVLTEFAPDAGRVHASWETSTFAARVQSVSSAIDRGCPLGEGPVDLAQNVGRELDRRVLSQGDNWLPYARMGDVLLRMGPSTVGDDPDGSVAQEVAAMQSLAALGSFAGLLDRVNAAAEMLHAPTTSPVTAPVTSPVPPVGVVEGQVAR